MDVDDSLNFSFPADPHVGDLGDAEDALSLNFNWTVEQELLLFEAMMGHKPVGADKNIHMMCIHRKMNQKWRLISKSANITPKHIWTKLRSMYDLQALDESECLPFPEKNEDFVLPKEEFEKLMIDYPTKSNETSRSSTVDREVDEESKNSSESKDDLPAEEAPAPDPAAATAADSTASAASDVTTSSTSASTASTAMSSAQATPATTAPATTTFTTSVTASVTPSSGPVATSTPTSAKQGRKRTKTSATANQSDSDKTPSGPTSAKRSRR